MNKIKQYIIGTLAAVAVGVGALMFPRTAERPEDYTKYAGFNEQLQTHEVDVRHREISRYTRLTFDYDGKLVSSIDIDIGDSDSRRRLQRMPSLENIIKSIIVDVPAGPYNDMLATAKDIQSNTK